MCKKKYTSALFRILTFFLFFLQVFVVPSFCVRHALRIVKNTMAGNWIRVRRRELAVYERSKEEKIPIELYSSSPAGEVISSKTQWLACKYYRLLAKGSFFMWSNKKNLLKFYSINKFCSNFDFNTSMICKFLFLLVCLRKLLFLRRFII